MTSIKVPPLGESIVEATVSKWLKNEGDAVAPGDTLVELETDKITVEVPSVTGGVLKKRFAKEGDVVKLDQMLAEVDEKADGRKEDGGKRKEESVETQRVSPAAQRVAAETGADLSKVQGTGRGGVISKADVVDARPTAPPPSKPQAPVPPKPPSSTPLPPSSGQRETREKMTTRRKRIAEHLLESQHATAHLTTFNEIDMTAVEAVRGRVKE